MEEDLFWAILGLALVIVELLTGTFYLLMLGIAAFGAALAAWLGQGIGVQAVVAAVISGAGCYGVHVYPAKNAQGQMGQVEARQSASFEDRGDQGARRARPRYFGASVDALVEGEGAVESRNPLVLGSNHGNTLQ